MISLNANRNHAHAEDVISISGIIKDSETEEALSDVNVYLKGNDSIGTTTNDSGEFTIDNFPADSEVVISHVGYKTLTLSSDSVAEVKLEVNTLEEVSIIIKAGD
ncbi:MAG: carboxypeptidase-like regulatory domain-containing protein, partial [Rickettsiales bacterium]|nr:carboxypeptidase-like regulatory domain-containing protein [Rickettsiales bacterium]